MRRAASLLAAAAFIAATLLPLTSHAAAATGQGLELSPPVLELKADPGQTVNATIRIRNITSGPLVVNGTADDFGAKDEQGDPKILLDQNERTRYSLKYWISGISSVQLVPREVRSIIVPIRIPADAEPGGHYGVIRFTGIPPELEGSGVSLSASIGALVLLRVSGAISEKLSLIEAFASSNGHAHHWFEHGPITLTERFQNQGSVHVKPAGYVTVKNTLGRQTARLAISEPARNVLPDSVRRFDQTLKPGFMIGRYTARVDATYGTTGGKLSKTISFWVIPYKLLLAVIIGLVLLVAIVRTALRRYNRYIIAQASKPRK